MVKSKTLKSEGEGIMDEFKKLKDIGTKLIYGRSDLPPKVKKIITVEEGLLAGGFGSSILEFCSDNFPNDTHKISRIGLKDSFVEKYGTQELLFKDNNLTKEYLIAEMLK